MRKITLFIVLCCTTCLMSCKKWLQVQPEDQFTKEQIYSSAASISEVMNGIYLQLANSNIYGQNLTLDKLDAFAQRYSALTSAYSPYYYVNWDYTTSSVQSTILNIWSTMYETIGNDNLFIKNLNIYGNKYLDAKTLNKYLGAAYGLRAYMHFDLLRLFGPIYSDATKADTCIPYYKNYDGNATALLPADTVVAKIQSDIDSAAYYLANDDIQNEKGTDNLNSYRFNLYAVKALDARVKLWVGDKSGALAAAKEVIAAQSHFPWTSLASVSSVENPDRRFFSETIFNIFNDQLYDLQDGLFSSSLTDRNIWATGEGNQVDEVFENNQADYRYTYSWPYATSGSVSFRTFIKYQDIGDPDDDTANARYSIPLIRISEMYYIAAECESDPTQALAYLNTVRHNRGLASDIEDYANINDEIMKEYRKEFFGEGQLWYYYKRTSTTTLLSPNSTTGSVNIGLSNYVLPVPNEESVGR